MAAAISSASGSALQAVASRSPRAGGAGADFPGAPRFHTRYEELLASRDVDVVHIATPHTAHYENTLLCLNAGKHVVCEKPLTLSKLHAEKVIASARSKGLFLMEAVWPRFLPVVIRCEQLIRGGAIGAVQVVNTSIAIRFDRVKDRRVFDPALGGGALNELGTYPLAFAVGYLGPILSCKASSNADCGVDIQCLFQCVHAQGLSSGFCALDFAGRNHVTIVGSDGQAALLPAGGKFEKLALWHRGTGNEVSEERRYERSGYEFMVDHVNECIRDGLAESPRMPLAESLDVAGALERCGIQIQSNRSTSAAGGR